MNNWKDYTEEKLIEGCKRNKRKFQEEVYRRYASQMYAVCLSYADSKAEAKDILQDGFVKVFTKIHTYKNQGSFGGWIRRIITNTAIDHYRKSIRQKDDYVLEENIYEDEQITNQIMDDIGADSIRKLITQLPRGARMVFNMYAVEGYSHKEIAKQLKITEGTSKSQYKRARSLLQKWIVKNE